MLLRSGIVASASTSAYYIRPIAQGTMDGSSWGNAFSLASLPSALSALGRGGTIYIAADDGTYTIDSSLNAISINRSASQGLATITGINMNGTGGKATFNSTRVPWSTTNYAVGTPENGYDVFRIADGATGLVMSNFSFTNVCNGIIFLANASSITITDCTATNSFCLVQAERDVNGASVAKDLYAIPNLTLARLTSTGYEMGLFLSSATMTGFSATDITGDAQYNYGTSFMEGFHLNGTVTNPVVTNLRCDNSAYPNRGSVYWNGDGFVTENAVSGGTWTNCGGSGSDDGGMDTKDDNSTYNSCFVKRNKKNFKHWANTGGTHNDPMTINPFKNGGTDNPQHWLFAGGSGNPSVWNINRPIIRSDNGYTPTILRCEKTVGSLIVNVDSWLRTKTATTFSITGTDTLIDSDAGLGSIKVETPLWLTGCANAANNNVPLYVTSAAAGTLALARMDGTAAALTNEAAGASITLHWGVIVDPGTTVSSTSSVPMTVNWTNPGLPTISSFTLTWRTGSEQGVIDQATSVGAAIADLSLTGSNLNSVMYTMTSDPDGKFQVSSDGTQLQLKAALDPSVKTSHTGTVRAYDITGLAKQDISFTIYVNATTLDTATAAFDTALQSASLPYLTDGTRRRWRSAYDNLIRETKRINSGAFWTGLDGLIVPYGSFDVGVSKRNLKQNAYHATYTGSGSWTNLSGWTGNGVDGKIDIAFNASTAGGNFQQNSNHMAIDVLSDVDETALDFSVDTTTRTFIRSRSAGNWTMSDQASGSASSANTNGIGYYCVSRAVSTSYIRIKDASSSSRADTSNGLANANLVAGRNSVSGTYTTRRYGCLHWGAAIANGVTDTNSFRTALSQFKAQAALAE